MGTTDKEKNRLYVAKHRAKKRMAKGDEEYKKDRADEMQSYRKEKKEEDKEEYLKKNAEYMREYRKKKAESKKKDNTEILRKIVSTKEGTNIVADVLQKVLEEIPVKRNVGRPRKVRKPVGRPRKNIK